jgi:NADH-quinone oxidoreductase subunit I
MREDLLKKFNGKVVGKKMGLMEKIYFPAIIQGLKITLKHLFGEKVTIEYPEEKRVYSSRFRGRHVLKVDENGIIKCVACELCEIACPSFAIKVVAKKSSLLEREREPEIYEIDYLRCIFCGLCVDACPCDALHMTSKHEWVITSRKEAIWTKEMLMEKKNG